jgi:hypothetical protein
LELRQIQYFMEVAKREHVTEATMALHVAQSAVSRQVFNLEKELVLTYLSEKGVINGDFDMALIGPVPKQEMKVLGTTLFTDNIVALPTTHPLAN